MQPSTPPRLLTPARRSAAVAHLFARLPTGLEELQRGYPGPAPARCTTARHAPRIRRRQRSALARRACPPAAAAIPPRNTRPCGARRRRRPPRCCTTYPAGPAQTALYTPAEPRAPPLRPCTRARKQGVLIHVMHIEHVLHT